jgi:hypothetical protein
MKTNPFFVLFLFACSSVLADSPADSVLYTHPTPDKMMWTYDDKFVLPDSLNHDFNQKHGIIPYDYSKAPNMLKIFPNPNVDAKILKLMPGIKKAIIYPEKKLLKKVRPGK